MNRNARKTLLALFSRRLRLALHHAKVSQRQACTAIGVTPATMQYWLNRKSAPNAIEMHLLCKELSVPFDYFFSDRPHREVESQNLRALAKELRETVKRLESLV